jgi:hypothetical protein
MGAHQDIFFDQPRAVPEKYPQLDPVEYQIQSLREFVFGYYLRLAESRAFAHVEDRQRVPVPKLLDRLSWRPEGGFGPSMTLVKEDGFEFRQVFYKRMGTGEVGKFPADRQLNIVNMLSLGTEYEWLVLKTVILNSDVTLAPLGAAFPQLRLPVKMSSYLVLNRSYIEDSSYAEGPVRARFGVNYALVKDPAPSTIVYGPGHFDYAVQMNRFDVLANGRVQARLTLLGNQPKALLNVFGFDPVFGYVRAMNILTAGLASRVLSINRDQAVKFILFNHCSWVFNSVMQAFHGYHRVPDWLDPETRDKSLRE